MIDYCEHCGKALPDRVAHNQKYCSYECQYTAYNKLGSKMRREARAGRKCLHCQGPISDDRPSGTIFCGLPCYDLARKSRVENTCIACGTQFRSRHPANYCSAKCNGANLRRGARQCLHCGSEFQPRRAKSQFCGVACSVAARSDHMRAKIAAGEIRSGQPDEAKREAIAAALSAPRFWRPNITEIATHLGVSTSLVRKVHRSQGLTVGGLIAPLTAARFDEAFIVQGR